MPQLEYQAEQLPPQIQRLVPLCGIGRAVAFAKQFGGKRFFVPKKVYSTHPLVKCVGWQGAQRISAEFGGEDWTVPSARTYLTWLEARALRIVGLSRRDIALKLGVTLRHIDRLLSGFEPEQYELNGLVRSIARCYGVRIGARATAAPDGSAAPAPGAQLDFGWRPDARGLRLTDA
jgi:hypothetical protein